MIVVVLLTAGVTVLALGVGLALRSKVGQSPEQAQLRARTAGLTWSDRWRVLRAVSKGRAVRDPALAAAAVARARYTRTYGQRVSRGPWRWALPGLAILQFVVAGTRLLDRGTTDLHRWIGGGSSAVLGVLLLTMPLQWRLYGRRADRAEQLNLGLLYEEQNR